MKNMKRIYLLSTFALMLCGVMIWSCSQEETENIGKVYRYSPEEISKLRSMAEEYGIPEVRFITESEAELPTMDEMKEAFMMIASINMSACSDVELVDKNEEKMVFRTKISSGPRILKRAAETNVVGFDASKFVSCLGTNLWLTVTVSVSETTMKPGQLNPYPERTISVNASLELPEIYKMRGYYIQNEKTHWSNGNPDIVNIEYTCDICLSQIVLIGNQWIERKTVEESFSEMIDVYIR